MSTRKFNKPNRTTRFGAQEVAHCLKCVPYKQEDLSLDPCLKMCKIMSHKKYMVLWKRHSVETIKKIRGFGRRGTKGDSNRESNPGSLSGQLSYCLRSCSGKNLTIHICKYIQLYSPRIKCLQCASPGRQCLWCASPGRIHLCISQGSLE